MVSLRDTTKKKIYEALEKSYFTEHSFSIKFIEDDSIFLIIDFIPDKKFSFSAEAISSFNSSSYITHEAPGAHIETGERFKHDDIASLIKSITPWTARILEDYRARNPLVDEFESFRKTLSEQFEEHMQDKDSHFTAAEAEALRASLDELSAKLHEVWEKSESTEQRLREAEQEIARIKGDIELFPKGVWYRVAGSKIIGAVKKVMGAGEGRQFALEAARKFFLESPK